MNGQNFKRKRFNLSLLNVNENLDLRKKEGEISEAIKKILSGGEYGDAYKDVRNIEIIKITKRNVQLECIESDKNWHMHLGYELANKYNMREFCYKYAKDKEDVMFEWN